MSGCFRYIATVGISIDWERVNLNILPVYYSTVAMEKKFCERFHSLFAGGVSTTRVVGGLTNRGRSRINSPTRVR